MTRPLLLDLYCCAGGASTGYHRGGFDVIGVDLSAQPRYPFPFHQGDALEALERLIDGRPLEFIGRGELLLEQLAAAAASPPCQRHSAMSACRPGLAGTYPDLVAATRELLEATGLPYVLENVPGAPVRPDVVLCGQAFGRDLYRHRLFESNVPLTQPEPDPDGPGQYAPRECGWDHPVPASRAGHWTPGTIMSVAGNVGGVAHARKIMDMDWTNRRELGEAIPPYYTEHLAADLLAALELEAAA